jgi:hypothetical protein
MLGRSFGKRWTVQVMQPAVRPALLNSSMCVLFEVHYPFLYPQESIKYFVGNVVQREADTQFRVAH